MPFAAGGTTHILGRLIAQKLSEEYGQQFIVENKAGAGGNIGEQLGREVGPGRLHLRGRNAGTARINQYIYKNQPFDGAKDFAPVIVIARVPNL